MLNMKNLKRKHRLIYYPLVKRENEEGDFVWLRERTPNYVPLRQWVRSLPKHQRLIYQGKAGRLCGVQG